MDEDIDVVTVAAYQAAEKLTAALAVGDETLALSARADLQAAIDDNHSEIDPATREAVIADDPVTAAAIGWLSLPVLTERVGNDPEGTLDPDEVAAWRESPTVGVLRLIVLGRVEGRPLAELQASFPVGGRYGLAARGNKDDARKLAELLREQGILDTDEE